MKEKKPDYRKTLVLDSAYMPRSIITSERAFVVSYKGNAEIVDNHPESFGLVNPNLVYMKPSIIRVFKYVNVGFHKVSLSKENIFLRDNKQCVYCGDDDRRSLTLDHVIPRSKGGKDSWDNLVTACKRCNQEKDNLSVLEWGREDPKPQRPHYLMLVKKLHYIPESWKSYLFL